MEENRDTSFTAYSNKHVENWTIEEVEDYARKILDFDKDDIAALQKAKLNGRRLLRVPSLEKLESYGLSGAALDLWTEIEKTKNSKKSFSEPDDMTAYSLSQLQIDPQKEAIETEVRTFQNTLTPKKQQPSDAIRATAFRISKGSSSPVRMNPAFIARLEQNDGIIAIHTFMQKLKPNVQKITQEAEPNNDPKMPLMDREGAVIGIKKFLEANATAYKNKSARKNNYRFLTVTSGTGIGKTRLCKEVTGIAEQLPSLNFTKKRITIFLDFSNGDSPTIPDSTYADMSGDERVIYASKFIAHRVAAHGLLNCSYKIMYAAASTQGLTDCIELLNLKDVLQLIARTYGASVAHPVGVVLVLDEINYLFKYEGLAKEVIKAVAHIMCDDNGSLPQRSAGVILFPVISGTSVHGVRNTFQASDYGNTDISLGLLKFSSTSHIFQTCLPTKVHLLDAKWMSRLLLLYGNTPAILDTIIQYVNVNDISEKSFQGLVAQLDSQILLNTKLNLRGHLSITHIDCVLAGVVMSDEQSGLFASVEKEGLVYVVNNRYMLPYAYLRSANQDHLTMPPNLLPIPGSEYSWSNFELLDHHLQPIRIRTAIALYNQPVGSMALFLPQACAGSWITSKEIQLSRMETETCAAKFLEKTSDIINLDAIETRLRTIYPSDYHLFTFMPAPGNALFDILEFYQTPNKPIALFKQLKHLANTETRKTIGPKPINEWLDNMRKATLPTSATYDRLFMLITNKRVPKSADLLKANRDLIIVDNDTLVEYFGPTVATFANLIAFDETLDINQVDDEE